MEKGVRSSGISFATWISAAAVSDKASSLEFGVVSEEEEEEEYLNKYAEPPSATPAESIGAPMTT